ncbi:MAG: hypothetical protein ABIU63_15915 [Chitinophagaceae bacterium]
MKQNDHIIITGTGERQTGSTCGSTKNEGQLNDGLWMEFEDSFIRILSGNEPRLTYYHTSEIHQQSISC